MWTARPASRPSTRPPTRASMPCWMPSSGAPAARSWSTPPSMSAASPSSARPRMPIAASCAPRWTVWSWRMCCCTRTSSPRGRKRATGARSGSWIDDHAESSRNHCRAAQLRLHLCRHGRPAVRADPALAGGPRLARLALVSGWGGGPAGPGAARCALPSVSHLDGLWRGHGLDQHPDPAGPAVLCHPAAHRSDHEAGGPRSDAPSAGPRSGQLSSCPQRPRARSHGEALLMWELIKDLGGFMAARKKFWLLPLIIVMVLLGGLIVLGQGSAVTPFIYTLF